MRAKRRTGESASNIEVEPWVKDELSAIDKENKRKRIAKIRELNLLKIEQKTELEVLKQGSELQKIKKEMKISNSREADALAKSLSTNPAMQDRWLSWTDQQRAIIMAGIQQAKAQGSDTGMAGYMLLAQMNSKPTSSLKDILEVVQVLSKTRGEGNESKNIVNAIRLGFDMSMKNRPQESSSGNIFKETMNILKPFYDSLSNKDQKIYNQQFEVLKSQIQPLSQQIKEVGEIANLMGYQRGTGSQIETQVKLEEMKMQHQKWMAEQGWKREEWRDRINFDRDKEAKRLIFDRETEKNRWKAIMTIGTKWMDKVAPIIDSGVIAAQKRIGGRPAGATKLSQAQQVNLACVDCGTMMPVVGEPTSVTCPKCGLEHKKNVLK